MRTRWGVLISGNGSTLQSFLDGRDCCDVTVVIASRSKAYGIVRARRQGIPVEILPLELRGSERRDEAEKWILKKLKTYRVEKVFLAGYMRIVSKKFIEEYDGRIFNLHPSLLPEYKGLDAFGEALRDGKAQAGVTVHHVAAEVDSGATVFQRAFDVPFHRDEKLSFLWLHIQEQRLIRDGIRKITWQERRM